MSAAVDRKGTSGDSRRWSGEMARQRRGRRVEWLGHYSSAQTILVVGDGDLSFSLALAAAFGSGNNLVATSLDSYDALTSKYGKAESNVTKLEKLGATILHGVDAKTMKRHPCLKMRWFDRIVFNFPHAGFMGHENQDHMINAHQLLVRRFFRNASHLLRPDGEIHVSHKTGQPYDRWEIKELAFEFSLVMFEMVAFRKEDYPGYNQKRGDGERCDKEFSLLNGCTSKFHVEREEAEESAREDAYSIEHLTPYMASRGSSSQSSVKNHKAPVMLCACGSAAARCISNSERNPGRRYMRCKHARPISNSERNVGRMSSDESYPEDCYLWIWEDLLSKYVEDMVQYSTMVQRESLHRLQESLDVVTNLHQEKEQQLLLLQQELISISESLRSCEHARSTLGSRLEEEQRRSRKFTAAQRESDAATSAIQTAHISRANNAKNKFVQTEKREPGLGGKDGTSLLKAVFSLLHGGLQLIQGSIMFQDWCNPL